MVVCPLAEHFGGTKEFNRTIIQRASRYTQAVGGIMVIKIIQVTAKIIQSFWSWITSLILCHYMIP